MGTYFTLFKYVGHDIREIGDNLTEDQVRKFLLRSEDELLFKVFEYDDSDLYKEVVIRLLEVLNGEEWLYKHL